MVIIVIVVIIVPCIFSQYINQYLHFLYVRVFTLGATNFRPPSDPMMAMKKGGDAARTLSIATWNIAAINNNVSTGDTLHSLCSIYFIQ